MLLCSVSWGSIVFFGASAIEKISKVYFGDAVVLHHVKVSPGLSLSVGRIDFNFEKTNGFQKFFGTALDVDFKISLSEKIPKFKLTTKKLSLDDWGSLTGGSIIILPKNIFSWNDSNLEFFANSFELIGIAEIKNMNLKAIVNFELRKFEQVVIQTSDVRALDNSYPNVESAKGSIDHLFVDQNITEQKLSGQIFLEGLVSNVASSSAKRVDFKFEIYDDTLLISSSVPELRANDYDLLVNELTLSALLNTVDLSLAEPIEISSKLIQQEAVGLEIDNAKVNVMSADGETTLFSTGDISSLELYSGNQYLGSVSDTKFEVTSVFDAKASELQLFADVHFFRRTAITTEIDLKVSSIINTKNIYNCILVKCNLDELMLDYSINLDGEFIDGVSICVIKDCYLRDLSHKISFKNTAKFFNNLGKAQIFSPFVIAVMMSSAISGVPVGDGHLVSLP